MQAVLKTEVPRLFDLGQDLSDDFAFISDHVGDRRLVSHLQEDVHVSLDCELDHPEDCVTVPEALNRPKGRRKVLAD